MARKVIRERMDYGSYLGGRVKEELDGLAGLAGRYVVEDAKFEVFDLENGDELSKEAWETPFGSEFCIIEKKERKRDCKKRTSRYKWNYKDIAPHKPCIKSEWWLPCI